MERREAPEACEAPSRPLRSGRFARRGHGRSHDDRQVRFSGMGLRGPSPRRARPATRVCEALARTLRLPALHPHRMRRCVR